MVTLGQLIGDGSGVQEDATPVVEAEACPCPEVRRATLWARACSIV